MSDLSYSTPTMQTVALGAITLDPGVWPRTALDHERVELFAEMIHEAHVQGERTRTGWVNPLPPLVVVADGRGGYLLADGRHRYEAHRRLGPNFELVSVAVYRTENGQTPESRAYEVALWYSTVSAKPLTTAEKRTAVLRLISERPELSDRAIARLVGVSPTTVGACRAGMSNLDTGLSASGSLNDRQPSEQHTARRLFGVLRDAMSEDSNLDRDEFVDALAVELGKSDHCLAWARACRDVFADVVEAFEADTGDNNEDDESENEEYDGYEDETGDDGDDESFPSDDTLVRRLRGSRQS